MFYSRIWSLLIIALLCLAALFIWQFERDSTPEDISVPSEQISPSQDASLLQPSDIDEVPVQVDSHPVLPPLNDTDAEALKAWAEVLDSSAHRVVLSVLPSQHTVRKLTALLNGLAKGALPGRLKEFARLKPTFSPETDGKTMVLGESSYARYDKLVDILLSIDPKRLVAIYRFWLPRIEEAYLELGENTGSVHRRLLQTLDRVQAVKPVRQNPILLVHMYGAIYRYADLGLEASDPVTKQLLRSGPRNIKRIQKWCAAFAKALNT